MECLRYLKSKEIELSNQWSKYPEMSQYSSVLALFNHCNKSLNEEIIIVILAILFKQQRAILADATT